MCPTPSAKAFTNAAGKTISACSPNIGSPISMATSPTTTPSPTWSPPCEQLRSCRFLSSCSAARRGGLRPFRDGAKYCEELPRSVNQTKGLRNWPLKPQRVRKLPDQRPWERNLDVRALLRPRERLLPSHPIHLHS